MNPFDAKAILKKVKEDCFKYVWRESANIFPQSSKKVQIETKIKGTSHPPYDLIQKIRMAFLNLGFNENLNPVILDEIKIYKQYELEAPIILDR